MYSVQDVLSVIQSNPIGFSIAGIMVYVIGFFQYGYSLMLQKREHKSPWFFWQHAWYIGHDLTFVLSYDVWFNQMDFWLFRVLWLGCIAFVGIEILTLYRTVKYERQEVFGKYIHGREITEKEAWCRGIIGYILGIIFFYTIRIAIGDSCCLALMMSTNAIVAIFPSFLMEERGSREGQSVVLGILVVIGTLFTFAPQGIGFWATAAPVFREPWFICIGIVSIIGSIRYLVVIHRYPKKTELIEGKKPLY